MALAPSFQIFRHRAYLQFWLMRVSVASARQMQFVAIGWQVYDLARDPVEAGGMGLGINQAAFMLGLVGLVQFIPVLLLSLVGGQAADRLNRKMILVVSNLVRLIGTLGLLVTLTLPAREALPLIFGVAALLGVVNAFTPAAASALYPQLVPRSELPTAIAFNSLGFQTAKIVGPAVGGLLLAAGGLDLVYTVAFGLITFAILAIATAKTPAHEKLQNQKNSPAKLVHYIPGKSSSAGLIRSQVMVTLSKQIFVKYRSLSPGRIGSPFAMAAKRMQNWAAGVKKVCTILHFFLLQNYYVSPLLGQRGRRGWEEFRKNNLRLTYNATAALLFIERRRRVFTLEA